MRTIFRVVLFCAICPLIASIAITQGLDNAQAGKTANFDSTAAYTQETPEFDPSGYFRIYRRPRGLAEFNGFSLEATESRESPDGSMRSVAIAPRGEVDAGRGRFRMSRVTLEGDQITFTTVAVRGISYQFTGRFVQGGSYYSVQPIGVVLRGRLTKMRNGQRLAEGEVSFAWEGGD